MSTTTTTMTTQPTAHPAEDTTPSSEQALAELRAPHLDKAHVHLNNAGVGPLTARAERALVDVAASMRDGTLAVGPLLRRYEAARATFARLVGCTADDLAFFQTCASALTQVAFGLPLSAGDRIVLLDQEYPSNAYPWHHAARRVGADVVTVGSGPDFTIDHDALCSAIDARTRVVAVSAVQYQTGATVDLARVVDVAHKHGAVVVVDAIQALGMQPFDMGALGVDAVCGGTHKWLLGPLGHGFLAVTPTLRERLTPILHGAITYGTPDDAVVVGKPARRDIRRFEPGTPHLLGAVAGAASVELLLAVGVARLKAEAMRTAAVVEERARSAGLLVRARHDSPFVIVVPREDPTQVAARLRERGIAVGVRAGGLRITPHGFNDDDDVERLFEVLDDCA
jgi:selenocysteine lyase/cysteine desulfurase